MKPQAKTIILFLIYLVIIVGFCYWYKEVVVNLRENRSFMDLGPMLRYMLLSAIFNALFFLALKITIKFSIDQYCHLTTRAIALGLIFFIISGWFIPEQFDEYYVFTAGMGIVTLFVLVKEKLVFTRTNNPLRTP